MKLYYHSYKYYPYERQLALREVASLFGEHSLNELANGIEIRGATNSAEANRLVYFAEIHQGHDKLETVQAQLERSASVGKNRQATRYSVHGLHEYKGKFNPQIAKALLNIFGVQPGHRVLDPFCGSGTTLVECAHLGAAAVGIDINPFAVFIANAKLQALSTAANDLKTSASAIIRELNRSVPATKPCQEDARGTYLAGWFSGDMLEIIEHVKATIMAISGHHAPIFLAIASNILRDYSLQDPLDLRIRRRKSPIPTKSFYDEFCERCAYSLSRLEESQAFLGCKLEVGSAQLGNIAGKRISLKPFDAALTSPPYAMALPYIDTQRLSLVWLGLLPAKDILSLEGRLIGSREMRTDVRRALIASFDENANEIPDEQYAVCRAFQKKIGAEDGFRRKAVPFLLYRYFSEMHYAFKNVLSVMKKGAPFGLIVGHNHTILGGERQDIDTPRHLAALAVNAGWQVDELHELQTYQRYGYHSGNAVSAETLILLRK